MNNESRDILPMYHDEKQIVHFSDEAAMTMVSKPLYNASTAPFPKETREHDIRSFLLRPRQIDNFTWAATDAVQVLLAEYDLPQSLLSSDMPVAKTADFRFMRCNTKLRFLLNANKYSIGRLLVVVIPIPTVCGSHHNLQSLTSLTGYPHCFIDAGTQPTAEITVPYVNYESAYDILNDGTVPWARVRVYVMNALNGTSGSTTAEVSTYIWAEDLQLGVPTPQQITPFTLTYRGQMNTEAESAATSNSLSGTVKKVANISKSIASLGSGPVHELAGAASWVGEIASGALAAFGFSKPHNEQLVQPVIQQPARNYCSYNGVDNGQVLAYDSRNSIDIDRPLFGSSVDELDIAYVCSKPMFLETTDWSMSDVAGTVLRSWPVTPGFCAQVNDTAEAAPTLMAYVASLFSYWRGSINYKISVVGNQFYSGRLGLAFLSGYITVTSPVTLASIEAAPKVILDVRNSTEITMEVPYTMNVPFLRTRCGSRNSVGTQFTYAAINNINISQGLMVLFVVTPLKGPAIIPSTIHLNMFAYGGKDISFALPTSTFYVPYSSDFAPVVRKKKQEEAKDKKKRGAFIGQMNSVPDQLNLEAGDKASDAHLLHTAPKPTDSHIFRYGVGEQITSLRPLTRMFSTISAGAVAANSDLEIDPAYFGWDDFTVFNARYMRIARIFAFRRGSIRFKFIPNITGIEFPLFFTYATVYNFGAAGAPSVIAPAANNGIGYSMATNMQVNPFIEGTIPFYARQFMSPLTPDKNVDRLIITIDPSFNSAYSYDLLMAGGDDLDFGYLIGPPNLTAY